MARRRRVGILVYNGVQALDVVGPADAFAGASLYDVILVGLGPGELVAESGIAFHPAVTVRACPPLDTVIVPGGKALRTDPDTRAKAAAFVRARAARTRRVVAVCTGVFAVAPTGLLDGRRVTTHWRYADDLAAAFPKIRVDPTPLFVKDGRFYTSAGITAGIDLSLALIEEDLGPAVALDVARDLVVYLKRSGGQEQYSAPLQFQARSHDRLADVAAWIVNHLDDDLAVPRLAERANMSVRHFARLFQGTYGSSPAEFVERLRLGEARRLLGERGSRVDGVAAAIGFTNSDSFRRAFERRFGLTPSQYRGRFQAGRVQ